MSNWIGADIEEWKDPSKEQPKLKYVDHYDNDPDLLEDAAGTAIRWSKNVLVIAEDEEGLKREIKAFFTVYEWNGEKRWERQDRCYGVVGLEEEGLKVLAWAELPKRKKSRKETK